MPGHAEEAPDAISIVAEARRLASAELWPGFEFDSVPVAVFDGRTTWLVRHPAPPAGFEPVADLDGVATFEGRYEAVIANTSARIGDVLTATLMPAGPGATLRGRAGVLIHEAFHVFQRRHQPAWSANEAELFTYPVADADLLALRAMETAALRRALLAGASDEGSCWASLGAALRAQRFAALPSGAVAYERMSELNEGLAAYVEARATGVPDADVLPATDFAPEAVRQRTYATGTALARLLDRFAPDWRADLARHDTVPLDVRLARALGDGAGGGAACDLPPVEREGIRSRARDDAAALRDRRAGERSAFLARAGWTLIIEAPGEPMFPQGFDPLNVRVLTDTEVLHTRFLQLGNASGSVEVMDRHALTAAAGPHPLFSGVRTLTLNGLAEAPAVTENSGTVSVRAPGVQAEFRGATVDRSAGVVTVRLGGR